MQIINRMENFVHQSSKGANFDFERRYLPYFMNTILCTERISKSLLSEFELKERGRVAYGMGNAKHEMPPSRLAAAPTPIL